MNRAILSHRNRRISLLALVVASAVCLSMLAVRAVYVRHLTYGFMAWNLFLAWVPMVCASVAYSIYARRRRATVLLALCAAVWLLFFPNAPYMVTDLLHLRDFSNVPKWFDLIMMQSFAWTGFLLGAVSLYLIQHVVQGLLGRLASWLCVGAVLAVTGFGIYLGRFLRWNSWDVVTQPAELIADIAAFVRHPIAHLQTYVFSLLFSAFFIAGYLVLLAFTRLREHRGEENSLDKSHTQM